MRAITIPPTHDDIWNPVPLIVLDSSGIELAYFHVSLEFLFERPICLHHEPTTSSFAFTAQRLGKLELCSGLRVEFCDLKFLLRLRDLLRFDDFLFPLGTCSISFALLGYSDGLLFSFFGFGHCQLDLHDGLLLQLN